MSTVKPGSAARAAGKLYASAHVHAIRYGEKGSKEYRRAFQGHIGRFLSAVHAAGRAQPVGKAAGEPRDRRGRWARALRQGLDTVLDHQEGRSRAVTYPAGAVKRVAQTAGMVGAPTEVTDLLGVHGQHATAHIIEHILARVKKNLITL